MVKMQLRNDKVQQMPLQTPLEASSNKVLCHLPKTKVKLLPYLTTVLHWQFIIFFPDAAGLNKLQLFSIRQFFVTNQSFMFCEEWPLFRLVSSCKPDND